jgi:prepilin-type N-terminal cleavage/methylation domain-containing protein
MMTDTYTARVPRSSGFSLLELLIALSLMALFATVSLTTIFHFLGYEEMTTTESLVASRMRFMQSIGQSSGQAGLFWFAPYNPYYWLTVGPTKMGTSHPFLQDVNYRDGYLQMSTYRISYDNAGDSTVSGVVRLVGGGVEGDITLYMNSGLQVRAGVLP